MPLGQNFFLEIPVLCLWGGGEGQACPRLNCALRWYTSSSGMRLSAQIYSELMLPAVKAPSGQAAEKECNDFMTVQLLVPCALRIRQRLPLIPRMPLLPRRSR